MTTTARPRCQPLRAWVRRLVVTPALLGGVAAGFAAPDAALPGDAQRGAQIYATGRQADGRAVIASRAGVGELPATGGACVSCHRPSGWGGVEGSVLVPPVAGPVLFAPGRPPSVAPRQGRQWLRHQTRSAYTGTSLARALADGLDPDGVALSEAMPRYRLDPQAMADVQAYLHQLGRGGSPGVAQGVMHLATVITPDAPPDRALAVREAMSRWAVGMGFGATRVAWQPWALTGPPATWTAQLQAFSARQPVHALISGAGGEWAPVAAWCEAQRTPCLFPLVDNPPLEAGRQWSVYLSAGLDGEARMLAQRLGSARPKRLLQVVDSPAGEAAANLLAKRLTAAQPGLVSGVQHGVVAPPATLAPVAARHAAVELKPMPGDSVVLWLAPAQVQRWLAAQPGPARGGPQIYLSAQLAPVALELVPSAWRGQVQWASMRADPLKLAAGATLSITPWTQRLQLPAGLDPRALADLHAGTFYFGDAVAQARGNADPAFLLERLEAALDTRPAGSGYFRLSLGPGQRVAAQGGYFLAYAGAAHDRIEALPGFVRAVD